MNEQSFNFSGVRTVDYRNARYQGHISLQNKREGFGILLDDDMNIYCSEWTKGLMNGLTIIMHSNGHYSYGQWKLGQPNGINIYKNKRFIVYGHFLLGVVNHQVLAVSQQAANILAFNGQSITNEIQLKVSQFQSITSSEFGQQYITHFASKNDLISLTKEEVSLLAFFKKLSAKYNDIIGFQEKAGIYYFGFDEGLGIKFSTSGTINQHIIPISVGYHCYKQLAQIGIKYHNSQCAEQGNFRSKQLLSYNKYSHRPRQKCHIIYQKIHKKSLNFINEYFDSKNDTQILMQQFCQNKLLKKYKQLQSQYKLHKKSSSFLVKEDSSGDLRQKERQTYKNQSMIRNQSKVLYNKLTIDPLYSKSKQTNKQNKSNSKHGIKEKSKEKNRSYSKIMSYGQQQIAINNLVQEVNQIRFKNQTKCERCKSRGKSTSNISGYNKEKKQNKSTQNITKLSPAKQIKYLKHYQAPSIHPPTFNLSSEQSSPNNRKMDKSYNIKNHSPNKIKHSVLNSNLPLALNSKKVTEQQKNRQRLQIENQKRIRQQIYNQQVTRDIKANVVKKDRYNVSLSNNFNQIEYSAIRGYIPSDSHHQMKMQTKPDQRLDYLESKFANQNKYFKLNQTPQIFTTNSIQNLQNRRCQILRQFKLMNHQASKQYIGQSYSPHKTGSYGEQGYLPFINRQQQFTNTLKTQLIQSPQRQFDQQNRQNLKSFNRKYRDYLLSPQKLSNSYYKNLQDKSSNKPNNNSPHQPVVDSFIQQFSREQQTRQKQTSINAKRPKYDYYFE